MGDGRTWRKAVDPLTNALAEAFGLNRIWNPFRRDDKPENQERVARCGHPLHLVPITALTGVTAADRLYPDDGDGVARGGDLTHIQLAANGPEFDVSGLGVVSWDPVQPGGWMPEWGYVSSYDLGTKTIAVAPGFDHAPRPGTTRYALGAVAWQRELCTVCAEYAQADTEAAVVVPYYADLGLIVPATGDDAGQQGLLGTPRELWWAPSPNALTLDNRGTQVLVRTPGRFNGRTRTDGCLGGSLVKFYLQSVPASGVALCVGCT